MNNYDKLKLLAALVFVLINSLFLFFMFKKQNEQEKYLKEIQIVQKNIDESIVRSSSSFTKKEDLEKMIKESKIDLSKIEKDIENLNGRIESFNKVQVVTIYQKETNKTSDFVKEKDPKEKVEIKPEELKLETNFLELKEKFPNTYVPIGNVGFSHWRKNPWEYEILERKYNIANIIAKNDRGETIVYNKFSINTNNKDYDVKIDKAENIYSLPENKFHLYPKFWIGSGIGYRFDNSITTSVSLIGNFIQYGQFKNNPKLSLLGIGVGKSFEDTSVKVMIIPIMYNMNNIFSFIQNTYIGPSFSLNSNKLFDVSVNLALSF